MVDAHMTANIIKRDAAGKLELCCLRVPANDSSCV